MISKTKTAAALLAAVFIFTGCQNVENSENSSTSPSSAYSAQSSEESSVSSSSSSESSSLPEESVPEEPETDGFIFLNYDPVYCRKIKFEGSKITITGKIGSDGLSQIVTDIESNVDIQKDGDEFTAVIEYVSAKDCFTTLRFYDDNGNRRSNMRIKIKDGQTGFGDSAKAVAANEECVEKALEQPLNQVSEYVTSGSDPERVKEVLTEIKNLSDEICEGLTDDYDKLRAIEHWTSDNIYYNYIALDQGIPAETLTLDFILENKASVCGGYSNMTAALAAAQGIEIYNVHGYAAEGVYCIEENSGLAPHEWNYAVIDGRVIWVDAGYDSRCYYLRSGEYEYAPPVHVFFDVNAQFLAQTHLCGYAEHRDYFALLDQ